jgi:hypothetical protein
VRRDISASTLIVAKAHADTVAAALQEDGNLIEFARRMPDAREMQGRLTAYAIALPSGIRVVVRRNHHGGAFRKLTGDVFVWPTAAPLELEISLALGRLNIPTPVVIAIAIHRAGGIFATSEVMTLEIVHGEDLGARLLTTQSDSESRRRAWDAVQTLLAQLASAGARHYDLNVKNILLKGTVDGPLAYVLDVDRVRLGSREADAGNRARLLRSLLKWRDTRGAEVSDAEIERLRRTTPSTP